MTLEQTAAVQCPDSTILQNLIAATLATPNADKVVDHVQSCEHCQTRLERLDHEETRSTLAERATLDEPLPTFLERLAHRAPTQHGHQSLKPPPTAYDWLDRLRSEEEGSQPTFAGYAILGEIGRGGMGIVFKARDEKLDRVVALKVLHPSLAIRKSHQERFLREARALASIDHPNVVPVYAVGQHESIPFIAMKLLTGESLAERLRKRCPLEETLIRQIGCRIANGLHAVHCAGHVHRDVMPSIIWLCEEDADVLLLDFGLAIQSQLTSTVQDRITHDHVLVGTPAYMSPEQARREIIDHRSDLFSLGVVLYEAATAQLPFRGDNPHAVLASLAADQPPPIEEVNPSLTRCTRAAITQLLKKDATDRPDDAAHVARLFEAPEAPAALLARTRTLWNLFAASVLAAALAGIVLSLQTPQGRLTVELAKGVDPEDVKIEMRGADDVRLLDASGGWTLDIKRGTYSLRLVDGEDRFEIDRDDVTIRRDHKTRVRVSLERDRPPMNPVEPEIAERSVAQWALNQNATLTLFGRTPRIAVVPGQELPQGEIQIGGIEFFQSNISDEDIFRLRGLDHLVQITLNNRPNGSNELSGHALHNLAELGLPELRRVTVKRAEVHKQDLQSIANAYPLWYLQLERSRTTDADLVGLENCRSLGYIKFMAVPVQGSGLKFLTRAPLRDIFFYQCDLSDATEFDDLPPLLDLRVLRLDSCKFSPASLRNLLRNQPVTTFQISNTPSLDVSTLDLSVLANVQELLITNCGSLTDADLTTLSKLSKLEQLTVYPGEFSDTGLQAFAAHATLKTLSVGPSASFSDSAIDKFPGRIIVPPNDQTTVVQ